MSLYFVYVTSVLSSVVFSLEFLGSIFAGVRQGFGFPIHQLALSCVFGLISQALNAAYLAGLIVEFDVFPAFLQVYTFFSYLQLLMLLFLPVLAIFLLIRRRKQRKHENDHGVSCQTPKAMTILVYLGYFYGAVSLILMFISMGLAGRFNHTFVSESDILVYGKETTAVYMILWFYVSFWIIVACFHRSIQLQHVGSFIAYGVLMTLPMISLTITSFLPEASAFTDAGQYIYFFMNNVSMFFAVALSLIYAHRWIALPELPQSPSA